MTSSEGDRHGRGDGVAARRGTLAHRLARTPRRQRRRLARLVGPVDAWQRAHVLGGFPVAVVKKFSEDGASSLAALIAYYASSRCSRCCSHSSVLVSLGMTLVVATVVTGLAVGAGIDPTAERGFALAISLAVDVVVLLAAFAVLTPQPRRLRDLLPGVGLAALGQSVLQAAGAWYVQRTIAGASDTQGTFALVIGVLSWFWLAAHLMLIAAETNVVLCWRLWPRSLTGDLSPADQLALRRSAEATRVDRRERIAVSFGEGNDRAAG